MEKVTKYGKYRKTKAYGLVGCIGLISALTLVVTQPVHADSDTDFNRTVAGTVDTGNSNTSQPNTTAKEANASNLEVEFKNDRIKVTEKSENKSHELQNNPYLIVKETTETKVDQDPGLVNALNHIKGDSEFEVQGRKDIQDLMNRKTGVVFKVRSYEADGSEGWRYFRTWTGEDTSRNQATTKIPYYAYGGLKEGLGDNIDYVADNTIDYGKAFGDSIGGENSRNVGLVTWTLSEPTHPGEEPLPSVPDFSNGKRNEATLYERYEGDDEKRDSAGNLIDAKLDIVHIGTKPETSEEVVEAKKTKLIR